MGDDSSLTESLEAVRADERAERDQQIEEQIEQTEGLAQALEGDRGRGHAPRQAP